MKAPSPHTVLVAVVVLVVAAAVTAGLVLVGSPSEARLERLDARRVEDLQRLSRLIDVHWAKHGRLPASLDKVDSEPARGRHQGSGDRPAVRVPLDRRETLRALRDVRPATQPAPHTDLGRNSGRTGPGADVFRWKSENPPAPDLRPVCPSLAGSFGNLLLSPHPEVSHVPTSEHPALRSARPALAEATRRRAGEHRHAALAPTDRQREPDRVRLRQQHLDRAACGRHGAPRDELPGHDRQSEVLARRRVDRIQRGVWRQPRRLRRPRGRR